MFLSYFKSLRFAPRPKANQFAYFIAGYFVFFFGIYATKDILSSIMFFAGMAMCYSCNSKPNFESVFPINHRKKLLYRFLSALLMAVVMFAAIVAVAAVVFLITFIFVSITSGGFGWLYEESFIETSADAAGLISVYGSLFQLANLIIMYSAGMIANFIKRRKTRNIYLACFCGCVILADIFMALPYIIKNKTYHSFSPLFTSCYAAMDLPWLSTVFWFLAAAGMLGTAIYMGMKHYNPKKF